MKTLFAILVIVSAAVQCSYGQNINWRSLDGAQQNIMQLTMGYDYAATAQLGYSRTFEWFRPMALEVAYTYPMGEKALDDFKVRLGYQIEAVEFDGFSATVKIASLFRRYETDMVRIVSFGADIGAVTGYFASTWYAAGELGFDKSITSNLRHSDIMRNVYPGIKDGWYLPSGGHWYYGVQGGKTIGDLLELTLRLGATNSQGSDENAYVPYYAHLGVGVRF